MSRAAFFCVSEKLEFVSTTCQVMTVPSTCAESTLILVSASGTDYFSLQYMLAACKYTESCLWWLWSLYYWVLTEVTEWVFKSFRYRVLIWTDHGQSLTRLLSHISEITCKYIRLDTLVSEATNYSVSQILVFKLAAALQFLYVWIYNGRLKRPALWLSTHAAASLQSSYSCGTDWCTEMWSWEPDCHCIAEK